MTQRFSPAVFAIVFSAVYAASYWFNQPLFLFYPEHNLVTWGPKLTPNMGPGMAWYGFLANCFIVATPLALLIPNNLPDRLFRNWLFLFPVAAMLICVYLLRVFFR